MAIPRECYCAGIAAVGFVVVLLTVYGMLLMEISSQSACLDEETTGHRAYLEENCGPNIWKADKWKQAHLCVEYADEQHHPVYDRATKLALDKYGLPGWITWTIIAYMGYIVVAACIAAGLLYSCALNKEQEWWREDIFPRTNHNTRASGKKIR